MAPFPCKLRTGQGSSYLPRFIYFVIEKRRLRASSKKSRGKREASERDRPSMVWNEELTVRVDRADLRVAVSHLGRVAQAPRYMYTPCHSQA